MKEVFSGVKCSVCVVLLIMTGWRAERHEKLRFHEILDFVWLGGWALFCRTPFLQK
jgi:hypothetical protein